MVSSLGSCSKGCKFESYFWKMNNFLSNTNKYKLFSIVLFLINLFLLMYIYILTNEISISKNIIEENEKLLNSILSTKHETISVINEDVTALKELPVENSKSNWIKITLCVISGIFVLDFLITCSNIPEKIFEPSFVKFVFWLGLKYIFGPFDESDDNNSINSDLNQNDKTNPGNAIIPFFDNEKLPMDLF